MNFRCLSTKSILWFLQQMQCNVSLDLAYCRNSMFTYISYSRIHTLITLPLNRSCLLKATLRIWPLCLIPQWTEFLWKILITMCIEAGKGAKKHQEEKDWAWNINVYKFSRIFFFLWQRKHLMLFFFHLFTDFAIKHLVPIIVKDKTDAGFCGPSEMQFGCTLKHRWSFLVGSLGRNEEGDPKFRKCRKLHLKKGSLCDGIVQLTRFKMR